MAFYERDYIEIKRNNSIMEIVGTRREGIEQDEVVKYMRKVNAQRKRAPFLWALLLVIMWAIAATPIVLDCLFSYEHRPSSFTIGAAVLFAIIASLMTFIGAKRGMMRREKLLDPESPEQQLACAGDALDKKLHREHGLCEAHDMVSVDSALAGFPLFIGSFPTNFDSRLQMQRLNESATLGQYAKKRAQAQMETLQNALENAAAQRAAPQVVDLRSDAERAVERNSGSALAPEREQLARDMVEYLKTHDTGNNMDHYREFRERFHGRSEAIAEGGGYHQALQEIYYRIRQLCGEEGVYFHAGGVDDVFSGEYWRS